MSETNLRAAAVFDLPKIASDDRVPEFLLLSVGHPDIGIAVVPTLPLAKVKAAGDSAKREIPNN